MTVMPGSATPPSNTMTWEPGQYLSFKNQRLRPALELLGRVPLPSPERVVDLGCGAGNVTRFLRQRWPQAALIGVDSSAEMLAAAKKDLPEVQWLKADMGSWEPPEPVDLIYSNAALHWLRNHPVLFPSLLSNLRAGGVTAGRRYRVGRWALPVGHGGLTHQLPVCALPWSSSEPWP